MRKTLTALLATAIFSITGMGANIVPVGVVDNIDLKLAGTFLNTYHDKLLSSSEKDAEMVRRTKEGGFKYLKGSDAALKSLSGKEDFSVSFNQGEYVIGWSNGGRKVVECTFPATITLLTFKDKIDLENQMIARLKDSGNYSYWEGDTIPTPPLSKLEKVKNTPFYVLDKGYFKLANAKNRVFFKKHPNLKDCGELVWDDKYKYETLSNMLLTGQTHNEQTVNVKVDKYRYETETVTVPFNELFNILAQEGSTPYWGIDKVDGRNVKGVYIWVNRPGGYVHKLTVEIPLDAPSKKSEWNAKLHCYVRMDNVKSLFEEIPGL